MFNEPQLQPQESQYEQNKPPQKLQEEIDVSFKMMLRRFDINSSDHLILDSALGSKGISNISEFLENNELDEFDAVNISKLLGNFKDLDNRLNLSLQDKKDIANKVATILSRNRKLQ